MSSSSEALCKAELSVSSFHEVLNRAVSNDFIYLDPPYVPLSPTADFSSYTASGFNETLHNELLDVSKELRSRGAYVMVSNSYSPWVIENYEKAGFRVNPIAASRNVAAKASSRRRVQEALIFGY
jgi:DNA adenine methylase